MMDRPEEWLDELDDTILSGLGQALTTLDPPPADLDTWVVFALGLDRIDIEVARLQQDAFVGSGARAAEQVRTITFDCRALSLMMSVLSAESGVRIDGWLAPPGRLRVELRTAPSGPEGQGMTYAVDADETGRFVFVDIPHGLAQLVVHGGDAGERVVVTPSIVL